MTVTPGAVIDILVGQMGGASGGPHGNENGGGGGTFVVQRTGNVPLVIAGGGGGAPATSYGTACSRSLSTGDAQAGNNGVTVGCYTTAVGGSGGGGGQARGSYQGGGGGGFTGDGEGGQSHCSPVGGGQSYVNGGAGGYGGGCYSTSNFGGYGGGGAGQLGAPGGGGGYSGGATAGAWSSWSTYGGGGGSYNAGSAQTNTGGINTGHGRVVLTWTVSSYGNCDANGVNGCEVTIGASCSVGVGACRRTGTMVCASGGGTVCSAVAGSPTAETCNNIDDNCNGTIDESLSQSCYTGPTGTAGVGICRTGTQVCSAGAWGTCTGQVLPATETCDGIDNDCDGYVDEGFCRIGGTCYNNGQANPATTCQTCVAPATANAPTAWTNVTNGTACGTPVGGACLNGACTCPTGQTNCSGTCRNLQTDVNNCGACGTVCSGAGASSTACVSGSCNPTCYTASPMTVTFNATSTGPSGTRQSWTVPAGVTSITVEAWGASGGDGSAIWGASLRPGGRGAYIRGTVTVTPGSILDILVGQMGGASGGPHGNENGGGGGSFVVQRTGNVPLIIAGGGGGAPGTSYGTACSRSLSTGDGQSGNNGVTVGCYTTAVGGSGGGGGQARGSYQGGGGGGFSGNGEGGQSHCSAVGGGQSYLSGGTGGYGGGCYSTSNFGGYGGGGAGQLGAPGGGGGYSGGATAGAWSSWSTYGGGGGSYNAGSAQTNTAGVNTGHGRVVITVPSYGNCDGNGVNGCETIVGAACTVGVGACQRNGTQVCASGGGTQCSVTAGTPTAETCNGIDDDCDGVIDDGFCRIGGVCYANGAVNPATTCQTCVAPANVSPPVSWTNVANGTVCGAPAGGTCLAGTCTCPSGFSNCGGICRATGAACTVGVGGCARSGTVVCGTGTNTTCSVVPGSPTTETCNGIDDDCNGTVDNNASNTCASALDLGTINAGGSTTRTEWIPGPAGAEQWYYVRFPLNPDVNQRGTGTPQIALTAGPSVRFDVMSSCSAALGCGSGGTATGLTAWSFSDTSSAPGANAYNTRNTAWPTAVYIRVYRVSAPTTCANVSLAITRPTPREYQAYFTVGTTPNPTLSCSRWNTFRQSIDPARVYSSVTLRSSVNPTGRTCTGAAANTICQALRNAHVSGNVSVSCGGHTWTVGQCYPNQVEINADGFFCNCASSWAARPCHQDPNFGGIGTGSCGAANQNIIVNCN